MHNSFFLSPSRLIDKPVSVLRFHLLFISCQIDYPEIVDGITPRHRFMAAYEQKIEPPDKRWQYLLFAAEPYETIAFKVSLMFSSVLAFQSLLL